MTSDEVAAGERDGVRVALVGGSRLHREGLAAALDRSPSIEIVLDADDAAGADDVAPDVVVVCDPAPPPMAPPPPDHPRRVIVLGDEAAADSNLDEAAYVSEDVSLDDLVDIVVRVARGDAVSPPPPVRPIERRPRALPPLTARETEILALIDQALTNREIAEQLHVEVATVKNHIHNILVKLRIQRRAQAAAWYRAQRRT